MVFISTCFIAITFVLHSIHLSWDILKPRRKPRQCSKERVAKMIESSPPQKKPQIQWINILFLLFTPIAAVVSVSYVTVTEGFHWWYLACFLIFYELTGLSITVGYHRLFSHKSFKTHSAMEFLFLFFGAGAFQNDVTKWACDHRIHHQHVDTNRDPYNINKGFFWAHMGWMFYQDEGIQKKLVKDLLAKKVVRWQRRYYLPMAVTSGLILPTLFGHFLGSALAGLAFGGLLRLVVVHHFTFFINSLCHTIGRRPYDLTQSSRDSVIMAFFTFGEGYHNFHHRFQADYRNGIKWYDFDPSKWSIQLLQALGLAHQLYQVSDEQILKAKWEVHLARVERYQQMNPEFIKTLKNKFEQTLQSICEIKRNISQWQVPHDRPDHLKAQLRLKQRELRELWNEFNCWQSKDLAKI